MPLLAPSPSLVLFACAFSPWRLLASLAAVLPGAAMLALMLAAANPLAYGFLELVTDLI